jgi:hypothetical protein
MSPLSRRTFLALSAAAVAAPTAAVAPPSAGADRLRAESPALLPVGRELFLLQCHVAGTSHVPIEEIAPLLEVGERLNLRREPENGYDALAILVLSARGAKLGYVPRDRNQVLARLLDGGLPLTARLEQMQWFGGWLRVTMRIYLG